MTAHGGVSSSADLENRTSVGPEPPLAPARRATQRRLRANYELRRPPLSWASPGLLFVLLYFAAIVAGGWYAFTNWNGIDASAQVIGFANFSELFHDAVARGAIWHTFELTVGTVVLSNLIGLVLAVNLHRALKLRNVLRSIFFAPAILSPLAVSYIWLYIFDTHGALNWVLDGVGLGSLQHLWLGDPRTAVWAISVVMIWQFAGLCMVIYLAGLQSIPEELDEAAAIDGASAVRRFRRVTFPLLAPAMTVALTLPLIFSLRVFDQVIGLTQGGPANATETLATQVYEQTFGNARFGYGSALAVFMTLLVAVVAIAQASLLRAREARL